MLRPVSQFIKRWPKHTRSMGPSIAAAGAAAGAGGWWLVVGVGGGDGRRWVTMVIGEAVIYYDGEHDP